jgi:heme-degrading monooxygenase HmoA
MFARVGIFQGAPEHLDHAIRRGLEQKLPALQRLPGFAGLYVLADRQTGKTISMSLWETEPALRRASDESRRSWVAADLAATGRTEQAVAGYEVVLSPDSHYRAHSPRTGAAQGELTCS